MTLSTITLAAATSTFGATAKGKLGNPSITGAPEDQLRAPLEEYLGSLSDLAGYAAGQVVLVGETSLADLKTRPDYAVTVNNALVGFIEVKAPGKGADPRKFSDKHDKGQWDKLKSLPNLIYTDGNSFSLWQNGEIVGRVLSLDGDVETSGAALQAPDGLIGLLSSFLSWAPIPPKSVSELARVSARLCRLLRDEVNEQMAAGNDALTGLAQDWRKLLFPTANDAEFADGYAQAVTFGLLVARARNIELGQGIDAAAAELRKTSSLIGTALRLLTDQAENREALKTSLATLTRVLDKVDWDKVSKGKSDAWLYFYEDFLEVYDNALRKKTGSYYTPPEVVTAMVGFVDEALRSPDRFDRARGLASKDVTIADPAVGIHSSSPPTSDGPAAATTIPSAAEPSDQDAAWPPMREANAIQLLQIQAAAIEELRRRSLVRTGNAPLGDYAEYLFARAMGWSLATNSAPGSDALDGNGVRYQIKARRLRTNAPGERQLGVMRSLPDDTFDHLAAVLFDRDFAVRRAAIIPHAIVLARAMHIKHVNGWRFMLDEGVWEIEGVRDVTRELFAASVD